MVRIVLCRIDNVVVRLSVTLIGRWLGHSWESTWNNMLRVEQWLNVAA